MSDSMLECVVVDWGVEEGQQPDGVVVWLHGLGADGHDFEPIVPELGISPELAVRFVFPHAPIRPVTLNGGATMRAWYDIKGMEFSRDEDIEGINESRHAVEQILNAQVAAGVSPDSIVLAGFSQGGAMAYHVGLRYQECLAGIMVLSGYLLLENKLDSEASEVNQDTPILQCHGTFDPVVPISMGEAACDALGTRGYGVEWKSYPIQHGVAPDEIRDVGKWLQERFSF